MHRMLELADFPLGKQLRLLRHAADLTLWDVGRKVGVLPARISELERGQREDPELAKRILKVLEHRR